MIPVEAPEPPRLLFVRPLDDRPHYMIPLRLTPRGYGPLWRVDAGLIWWQQPDGTYRPWVRRGPQEIT